MRFNQFYGVYRLTALIALVPACSRGIAVRAGALNIAVRQETLALGAERLSYGILVNITIFLEGEEDILCYLGMVGGAGSGE